ncbi:cytochrome c oxidase subunit VA-domain-containing protein [Lanmaoa asiatica]|nr:cytochrome c oxidase subunit VA-domain-containing protein [Lanmaoa asiatica]
MRIVSSVLRARPTAALRRTAALPARVRFSSSDAHSQETFEAFSDRYVAFFQGAEDLFEVQRGLNNCFAQDLVPSPGVIEAAVRAARRVNDYATAVRIFEGVKEKVENKQQYQAYLDELKPLREELGTSLVGVVFLALTLGCARVYARHRDKRRPVLFMKPVSQLDGWTR